MALSKTHILVSALAYHRKKIEYNFEKLIPLLVLPDAIRCFNFGSKVKNNRVITHFEVNPKTEKPSGMTFPSIAELKTLTDEKIQNMHMHVEPDYKQVAIGDKTSIPAAVSYNSKLETEEFLQILIHLIQDLVYDGYIRKKIDCSKRSKGIFTFKGESYDAKGVRSLITKIEEQEFRILAKKYAEETGVVPNMEWFEKNVKTAFESTYYDKMAESTWKYISVDLDSDIERLLTDAECDDIVEKMIDATEFLI